MHCIKWLSQNGKVPKKRKRHTNYFSQQRNMCATRKNWSFCLVLYFLEVGSMMQVRRMNVTYCAIYCIDRSMLISYPVGENPNAVIYSRRPNQYSATAVPVDFAPRASSVRIIKRQAATKKFLSRTFSNGSSKFMIFLPNCSSRRFGSGRKTSQLLLVLLRYWTCLGTKDSKTRGSFLSSFFGQKSEEVEEFGDLSK